MDRFGKFYWMLLGFLLAIIIVLLVVLIGNLGDANPNGVNQQIQATQATENSGDTLIITSITERADTVIVKTNCFQLKYPYAFSDMISVEAINEENKTALLFCAQINGQKHKLYELFLGGEEGFFVGTLVLVPGQAPVNMYATIYEMPTDQSDEARLSFIAAQETINDVMMSLNDNVNFEPAT